MLREEMSCRGTVLHIRRAPLRHAFRYRVWMLYVRLDTDTRSILRPRCLASTDRGHLLTLGEVRDKLTASGIPKAQTAAMEIFALTQPRSLGVSFNPVNFYFCYIGAKLAALLVDINNTPWDERYCYVLLPASSGGTSFRFDKRFHVSPFLPMEGAYVLRLKISNDSLRIAIRLCGGEAPFSACLSLRTRPLTALTAFMNALRLPAQGAWTLFRIYWQALRLFIKRAPFHPHPARAIER